MPMVSGEALPPVMFLRLFLAGLIKWPPAVKHFIGVSAEARGPSDFLAAFESTLIFCDGRAWTRIFQRMDSGPVVASTGLVRHSLDMGLIVSAGEAAGQPAGEAAGQGVEHIAGRTLLRLGRNLLEYRVCSNSPALRLFTEWFGILSRRGLYWPRNSAIEVARFAAELRDVIAELRGARCGAFGLAGGASRRRCYNLLCMTRLVMSAIDTPLRSTVDAMTMEQVLEWVPDVRGHVAPLHSWRAGDVRRSFGGMPPALVPMWCCMAGAMPDEKIHAAMRVPMRNVWRVYFDWRVDEAAAASDVHDPPYPPGPRVIAQLLSAVK